MCKSIIHAIADQLPVHESDFMFDMLAAEPQTWPHQAVASLLRKRGHPVSEATVRRYREAHQ